MYRCDEYYYFVSSALQISAEMQPIKKEKNRQRTGSQLHASIVDKVQRRWYIEVKKDKSKYKTAFSTVDEINATCGTNINEKTLRRYVIEGIFGVPIIGRRKKCNIPESFVEAMCCAVVSYIQLYNTGRVKMPDREYIIQQLQFCVKKSVYNLKRYDQSYDRIMESIADKISVNNNDFKMDQWPLFWITYLNINI